MNYVWIVASDVTIGSKSSNEEKAVVDSRAYNQPYAVEPEGIAAQGRQKEKKRKENCWAEGVSLFAVNCYWWLLLD